MSKTIALLLIISAGNVNAFGYSENENNSCVKALSKVPISLATAQGIPLDKRMLERMCEGSYELRKATDGQWACAGPLIARGQIYTIALRQCEFR